MHLVTMINASSILLKSQLLCTGLGIAITAWGLEGVGLFIVLQYLQVDCSLVLALGIYAVALLVGAVSFMPGGLGGTEAVMTLSQIAFGTDQSTAIAATIIRRIVTLWFAVVIGLVAALVLANMGLLPEAGPKKSKPG